MRKRKYTIFLSLLALVLVSCAESPSTNKYYSAFQSCRGFDFNKRFPGKHNRPLGVNYDDNIKRMYGKDGLSFNLFMKHPDFPKEIHFYNYKDLELSTQEKEYIANFDKIEEEFDRKYAGDIKKKLRSVSKLFTRRNGETALAYPRYLEGDALPVGVKTPVSVFSYSFVRRYIEAKKHPGDLRDFILSTEMYKDFDILDLAAGVGSDATDQASWRLKSLYAEYVLTWYLLKHYDSLEQRHQTALDLARYYSEVVFRGAAESLYHYSHILTTGQRCKIANYIAGRMYELVMVIDNPDMLRNIKREYNEEYFNTCFSNLFNRDLWKESGEVLKKQMNTGKERCVND